MSLRIKRALVVTVGLLVACAMVVLGLWQMDVFWRQGSASADDLARQPPIALPSNAAEAYGRRVTITGTYLDTGQVLVGTSQPLRVVTPFQTSSGVIVAVVRGTSTGSGPPAIPSGQVTQTGVWLPSETDVQPSPPAAGVPSGTPPLLKVEQLAQRWPAPVANGYLVLSVADASVQGIPPAAAHLPQHEGRFRNQGYALQWWVFAAFAVVGSVAAARTMRD